MSSFGKETEMQITGIKIMEVAMKITGYPVEGVLLKKTLRLRETGAQRSNYIRIDSSNAHELYDVDGYDFVPLPNMGSLNMLLSNLSK